MNKCRRRKQRARRRLYTPDCAFMTFIWRIGIPGYLIWDESGEVPAHVWEELPR